MGEGVTSGGRRGPSREGTGQRSAGGSTASASPRPLLRDVAFDHLRTGIIEGEYPPGTFLSEREMARTLEMSKTPIRVAFERLAELGLVTISPQRGVVVREMSGTEVADHYDLRIALETFTVRRLATTGVSAPCREELIANLRRQQAAVSGVVDIRAFMRADAQFHLLLAEAQGNRQIVRVMTQHRDRVQRVIESIHQRDPRVPVLSVREHRAILDAVLSGDAEAAVHAAESHLEHGKRFLLLGGSYGQAL